MFDPQNDQLVKYYQAESEKKAQEQRFANKMQAKKKTVLKSHFLISNKGMIGVVIVTLVVLVVIFFTNTSSAQGQEGQSTTFDAGDGETNGIEILYLQSAIGFIQQNNLDMALHTLNESITVEPRFAPAYITRAYIRLLEQDYELAEDDAITAIRLNPIDGASYYIITATHFSAHDCEVAHFNYEVYLLWVEMFETEPIIINLLFGDNSMDILNENRDLCSVE